MYIPDPGYVLVLKMISARDKDLEDMEALFQILGIKQRVAAIGQRLRQSMKITDRDEQRNCPQYFRTFSCKATLERSALSRIILLLAILELMCYDAL